MSVIFGLLLGAGLLTIWWSFWPRNAKPLNPTPTTAQQLIARNFIAYPTVPAVVTVSLLLAGLVFICLTVLTGAAPIGLCFGLFAGALPWVALVWQGNRRQTALREIWPDAIDNLCAAVRAGLTLSEALSQLADRGPEELRDAFASFSADYRSTLAGSVRFCATMHEHTVNSGFVKLTHTTLTRSDEGPPNCHK